MADKQVGGQTAARAKREIERTLDQIDRLYPTLYKLTSTLQDLGVDLEQPLPANGGLSNLADYGRAVIGLGKFLIAIGGGILLLAGGENSAGTDVQSSKD